ncbi:hypothetical protein OS493_003910 [Desmophyllum pertusum]|uniref:Uncharacterized protein n=1 Tax=Desmophyllum pertusum TaxID=174260 RepID=A0A9X0D4F4_9CNID|nr:hypothetical protein OS493_003910 [Desmophyllum pertusum]
MAVKIIFWSCLVAILGYFAYQELTVVTDSISLQTVIPAKRSDVFRVLLNPEFVPLKFQPLCVSISNITTSQEQDGPKTFQFIMQERISFLGFHQISKVITFQVNVTVIQENAEIHNSMNPVGGIIQVRHTWKMTDSKSNGGEDETLLEDHFEFTTRCLLARFVKRTALGVHTDMLKSIRKHFIETSKKHNDDTSA